MNTKKLRDVLFPLHRYMGLIVGLLLIIVGVTGSLLVFQHEIDRALIAQQFGHITPQAQTLSIDSILETIKVTYANQPDLKLGLIDTASGPASPYIVSLDSPAEQHIQVFVNPYTGAILGSRVWEQSLFGIIFKLHYELLAGRTGQTIVGIAALFLFILCITGIALWSGWRKLISGFKIKWDAHPKRTHYDIHKVAGIITAVFLSMIAFTGFCWNFYEQAEPAIHAVTFTPNPAEPVSKPIPGKQPLSASELLAKADAAMPGATTTYISLPQTPDGIFQIGKRQPQETSHYGFSRIILDQYTGEVLKLRDGLKPNRAEAVLNSFVPMHYGTFLGLPSRILYVFVGLAPLLLFITGFVMWWYRKRKQSGNRIIDPELVQQHR